MQYREMKKLGVKPSLLGFGCMRFPTVKKDGKEVIEAVEAERMIDRAIQGGVNYFDTAYPYHDGKSEEFVGNVLKKYERDQFYLATKLPMWLLKSKDDVKKYFEKQLENLQVDYVDFYLLHALEKSSWEFTKNNEILDVLEEYRKDGKIKYVGFSFHDEYEVFEEIIQWRDWDFCQIQLNYMDINLQAGLKGYELATKLGIPVIDMEPIKGGSLVNYSESVREIFTNVRPEWSLASWALRWVASLPNVQVILSGMSNMDQVEDNLEILDKPAPLTDKEMKTLDTVIEKIKGLVRNGCTGCSYCVPCPVGIEIPKCFYIWNEYGMFQNKDIVNFDYYQFLNEEKRADKCIDCGACETLCPQGISIREDLKKISHEFSGVVSGNM